MKNSTCRGNVKRTNKLVLAVLFVFLVSVLPVPEFIVLADDTGGLSFESKMDFGSCSVNLGTENKGDSIIEFDIVPYMIEGDKLDVIGYSDADAGKPGSHGHAFIQFRFAYDNNAQSNMIDARNGGSYTWLGKEDGVPYLTYESGKKYHFTIVADFTTQVYDLWITYEDADGNKVTRKIAEKFKYRSSYPIDDIGWVYVKDSEMTRDGHVKITNHTIRPVTNKLRVNAGADVNLAVDEKIIFLEDSFVEGADFKSTDESIDVTAEKAQKQELYQSYAEAMDETEPFVYEFSGLYPNEGYKVLLHFAETVYDEVYRRQFSAYANDNENAVLENYDIFEKAGGKNIAVVEELNVMSDTYGKLVLKFESTIGKACVSGIEILSHRGMSNIVNIKSEPGGTASLVGNNGKVLFTEGEIIQIEAVPGEGYVFDKWVAEPHVDFADANSAQTSFVMPDVEVTITARFKRALPDVIEIININAGGDTVNVSYNYYYEDMFCDTGTVASTDEEIRTMRAQFAAPEKVYKSYRKDPNAFSYNITGLIPNGAYFVRLHFAELEYDSIDSRMFDISINDTLVMKDYDIFADAGGKFEATIREFTTAADGEGRIKIDFTKGSAGQPCVSGIEIISMETEIFLHNLAADNNSYTCRRPFGAGLYDSVSNKTFICYAGYGMAPYVKEYDHNTKKWSEAVQVGEPYPYSEQNIGTPKGWHKYMYHDYPVMTMAPDGSILVFNVDHTHELFMAKSLKPRSVTDGWDYRMLTDGLDNAKNCYPLAISTNDKVFVFYSRNDDTWTTDAYKYRTYRAIQSDNNGETEEINCSDAVSCTVFFDNSPGCFTNIW